MVFGTEEKQHWKHFISAKHGGNKSGNRSTCNFVQTFAQLWVQRWKRTIGDTTLTQLLHALIPSRANGGPTSTPATNDESRLRPTVETMWCQPLIQCWANEWQRFVQCWPTRGVLSGQQPISTLDQRMTEVRSMLVHQLQKCAIWVGCNICVHFIHSLMV